MINNKIIATAASIAVILLSSGNKEKTEHLYDASLKSIAGTAQVDGATLMEDSLSGKMLILNFWASYDATSRINNYQLVNLYENFKNQEFHSGDGLEVVSVSLDKFKAPLNKAIETDGTDMFYHLCDYKGVESDLVKSFDVQRPINLLIDANGRVVARDFNVASLRSTLELLSCN